MSDNQDLFIIPTENAALDDVLIFPVGGFIRDGMIRKFTPEQAQEMVKNFKDGVLGRYVPVNKEHKREAGRVARIADLWLSDEGVRGALKEVEGHEGALSGFDYLSPEVAWSWTNPHTGQEHKNVLVGLAATNYPFFGGKMALHSAQIWTGSDWEPYQDSERDELKERRAARASRYSIAVKARSALTYPQGFPTNDADYGDPVNYRYPADDEHARAALTYFNQGGQREAGGYTSTEWAIIGRRLARLISKHLDASYEYSDGRLGRGDESSSDFQTEVNDMTEQTNELEGILERLAKIEGVAEDVTQLKALLAEREPPQEPEQASENVAEEYAQAAAEFKEKFAESERKVKELEEKFAESERKRHLVEWTDRVQKFSMAGEPEKFAEDMLTIAGVDGDLAERMMARFRSAQEQINVGGLFEQYAQAGSETEDGRTNFEREVEKVRVERYAGLDYAEGFTKAMEAVGREKPDLARQYVKGGK